MRVLLVEDDRLLGDGVLTGLRQNGYAVDWVYDGNLAEAALRNENYDLVILDLGLPNQSGMEVLRRLRARGESTPVLIVTARDTVEDKVEGLDTGADDYLIKPFDLDELLARVRAVARRRSGRIAPIISHGDITIDPAAHKVTRSGHVVDISPKEFALLQALFDNEGRVVSRSRLEEGLYAWNEEVESNAIEVHIHHLRKKLGAELIRTIRGVGYIIDKPPVG